MKGSSELQNPGGVLILSQDFFLLMALQRGILFNRRIPWANNLEIQLAITFLIVR